MLRPYTNITIQQVPSKLYPKRMLHFDFNFVEHLEIKSSWATLGDTCTFTLPRGISDAGVSPIKISEYTSSTTEGTGGYVSDFDYNGIIARTPSATQPPLLLRGDYVFIQLGYYIDADDIVGGRPGGGEELVLASPTGGLMLPGVTTAAPEGGYVFTGWITNVDNKLPIKVSCMDQNWLFQSFLPKAQVYPAKATIESIVEDMIAQLNYSQPSFLANIPSDERKALQLDEPPSWWPAGFNLPQTITAFRPAPVGSNVSVVTNESFTTGNKTLSACLKELQRTCFFEFWVRTGATRGALIPDELGGTPFPLPALTAAGNPTMATVLHGAPITYWPDPVTYPVLGAKEIQLQFQENILAGDSLQWTPVEDIVAAVTAFSVVPVAQSGGTRNTNGGTKFAKRTRFEVFVSWKNNQYKEQIIIGTPSATAKKRGVTGPVPGPVPTPEQLADGFAGNVTTKFYWNLSDTDALLSMAEAELQKHAYEGWRGHLTTIGLPTISHGDIVTLTDNILPERNGSYFVRGVTTTTGIDGFFQKIELDLRISTQASPTPFGVQVTSGQPSSNLLDPTSVSRQSWFITGA